MIHDQSSTGSTLFVEPMAVVKLNNDMRELELRRGKRDRGRSLAELSSQVAEQRRGHSNDIPAADRAGLHLCHGPCSPKATTDLSRISTRRAQSDIRKGRHPLLDPEKGGACRYPAGRRFSICWSISGPNTGGKTVSLKTVGLFTLMGQAGLHIPASGALPSWPCSMRCSQISEMSRALSRASVPSPPI